MPLPHPRSKTLPPEDALKGLIGEHAVMGLLNLISFSIQDAYVFHSVGISNELDGETDHIVFYGNKLLIIETKNYSNFTSIFINREGRAQGKKHGKIVDISDNGLIKKTKFYQDRFPHLQVEAVIVVTQSGLKMGSEYSGYFIVGIEKAYAFFEAKLAAACKLEEDNWPTVKYFANLCIRNEQYN